MTYTITDQRDSDDYIREVTPERDNGRTDHARSIGLNGYQQRMIAQSTSSFTAEYLFRQEWMILTMRMSPMKFHAHTLAHHTPAQLAYMFPTAWKDVVQWLTDHHLYELSSEERVFPVSYMPQGRGQMSAAFGMIGHIRPASNMLSSLVYAMQSAGGDPVDPSTVMTYMSTSEVKAVGSELLQALRYMGITVPDDSGDEFLIAAGYAAMTMAFPAFNGVMSNHAEERRLSAQYEQRASADRTRRREAEARVAALETSNAQRQRVMDTAAQFARAESPQEKLDAFRSMMLLVDEASTELEAASTS